MKMKIKRYLSKSNKNLLKFLENINIKNITFLIDPNNDMYFFINDKNTLLFISNSKTDLIQLLGYFENEYKNNININIEFINLNNVFVKDIVNYSVYENDKKRGLSFFELFNLSKNFKKLHSQSSFICYLNNRCENLYYLGKNNRYI